MITLVNSTNIHAKAAGGHHGGGSFLKADCGECSSPEVLVEASSARCHGSLLTDVNVNK